MARRLTTILGGFAALSMIVAAMWAWRDARRLAEGTTRPDVTLWAFRSAGVALAAAAQALIVSFVVLKIYRRRAGGAVYADGAEQPRQPRDWRHHAARGRSAAGGSVQAG